MGRWGFRLFEGDADIDARSEIEGLIVDFLKSEEEGHNILDTPELREVGDRIIQDAARMEDVHDDLRDGGGFYLREKIESGDPVVRKILDNAICHTLFDLAKGDRFVEIIIGVMMMQAGAKLRPKDKRRLRNILASYPHGASKLPENGFDNAGQAQLSAALDHYRAGTPRNFHTPSCFNCGKIEADIGTKLLECDNCLIYWWCNELAALTWGYEFYYDVLLGGQYTFKIFDLHKRYGPIIRINPSEIHIADKTFYHTLYTGPSHRRDKWAFYAKQFGADDSVFSTVDHDLHKLRRTALNPFFSTAKVQEFQPIIEAQVDNVLRRLDEHARISKEPLDLVVVFSAFTNDVINEYAFARSEHLVEKPDFGQLVIESILRGTYMGTLAKHMPWSLWLLDALPDTVTERWVPGLDEFNHLRRTIRAQIGSIKRGEHLQYEAGHKTIFHELLASSMLPESEKTVDRLAQDGQVLNQGGTLTTSYSLCVAVFHVLDQPSCLAKLRAELLHALPDPEGAISIADLQRLPYLGAVVKESLRLGFGGTGTRLGRVAPDETMRYVEKTGDGEKVWSIPPGTPVGMTSYQTLTDAEVFPDPFGFHPERWLAADTELQARYLIVFNAGTRSCLGQNLARAELLLMLARLFRRWGGDPQHRAEGMGGSDGGQADYFGNMKLFETTVRDTQMASDRFVPVPYAESKDKLDTDLGSNHFAMPPEVSEKVIKPLPNEPSKRPSGDASDPPGVEPGSPNKKRRIILHGNPPTVPSTDIASAGRHGQFDISEGEPSSAAAIPAPETPSQRTNLRPHSDLGSAEPASRSPKSTEEQTSILPPPPPSLRPPQLDIPDNIERAHASSTATTPALTTDSSSSPPPGSSYIDRPEVDEDLLKSQIEEFKGFEDNSNHPQLVQARKDVDAASAAYELADRAMETARDKRISGKGDRHMANIVRRAVARLRAAKKRLKEIEMGEGDNPNAELETAISDDERDKDANVKTAE
ncbi:hypothetical protein N0V82_002749 [Gnomoniopsis sp. IMI 355080]|nr:hypothetical protein N0V82_002749 [Gnomoniopsis sp. IMI 355080]